MKKWINRKNLIVIGSLFILVLFAYITYCTPLAGDDWGYALNGMEGHPIQSAIEFYQTWSGRFFSELWGFVVAPRKWLWNILNPLLFTLIFIGTCLLAGCKKKPIVSILIVLAIMLSVDDNLRMETYTWIMGTTYVVPLCLSLIAFCLIDKMFHEELTTKLKVLSYLSNMLLIVIGLMMENIAAVMVGGLLILIIYAYFKKKELLKYLIINFAFSTISFLIMRSSPGSAYRLMTDNADWAALSLFGKIVYGYPNFIEMTFINNNYMVSIFAALLSCLVLLKKNVGNYRFVSTLINALAVFSVFSFVIFKENNPFAEGIFPMLYWPIFVTNAFISLWLGFGKENRDKAIFILLIGGAAALAMIFSPIYGSRSSLYTVYYIAVLSAMIAEELDISKCLLACICIVCLGILLDRTMEYISKYKQVAQIQEERMEILTYYQRHPEDTDVWIPRFPVYTVHGGDIEPDDTYHFEVFKEYYQLPQSADDIHFYFKDSYD